MDTRNKVLIKKSASKKEPFKTVHVGKNGEPIGNASERFVSKQSVIKNLKANLNLFNGAHVTVIDMTGKKPVEFVLFPDGKKVSNDPITKKELK